MLHVNPTFMKKKLVTFDPQILKLSRILHHYFATSDIVSDSWHRIITKVKKAVKKIATFLPVK